MSVSWRLQEYGGAGGAGSKLSAAGRVQRVVTMTISLPASLGSPIAALKSRLLRRGCFASVLPPLASPKRSFGLGGLSRSQGACFGAFASDSISFGPSSRTSPSQPACNLETDLQSPYTPASAKKSCPHAIRGADAPYSGRSLLRVGKRRRLSSRRRAAQFGCSEAALARRSSALPARGYAHTPDAAAATSDAAAAPRGINACRREP